MSIDFKVVEGVGISDIPFGSSKTDATKILGSSELDYIDESGDNIITYSSLGIEFLSYDKEEDFKLTVIELNSVSQAILRDKNIFNFDVENLIYFLVNEMGVNVEQEYEGDIIYSINVKELGMTFYLENEQVKYICVSVLFDINDKIIW